MTKPEGVSRTHARIGRWDCDRRRVNPVSRPFAQGALHQVKLSELILRISSFFRHSSLELRHFRHLYSRQFA
jgi:hypothetical protein